MLPKNVIVKVDHISNVVVFTANFIALNCDYTNTLVLFSVTNQDMKLNLCLLKFQVSVLFLVKLVLVSKAFKSTQFYSFTVGIVSQNFAYQEI